MCCVCLIVISLCVEVWFFVGCCDIVCGFVFSLFLVISFFA